MYLLINYTLIARTTFKMYSRTKKMPWYWAKLFNRTTVQEQQNRVVVDWGQICPSFCYEGKDKFVHSTLTPFFCVWAIWKWPLERAIIKRYTDCYSLFDTVASHILKSKTDYSAVCHWYKHFTGPALKVSK